MAKLKKSVNINAPVEKVFGYIEDPINRPEFWPSLVEVKDVERLLCCFRRNWRNASNELV